MEKENEGKKFCENDGPGCNDDGKIKTTSQERKENETKTRDPFPKIILVSSMKIQISLENLHEQRKRILHARREDENISLSKKG